MIPNKLTKVSTSFSTSYSLFEVMGANKTIKVKLYNRSSQIAVVDIKTTFNTDRGDPLEVCILCLSKRNSGTPMP